MTAPMTDVICELTVPMHDNLLHNVRENARIIGRGRPLVEWKHMVCDPALGFTKEGIPIPPNSRRGKHLVIAGAGPSLQNHHEDLLPAHEIWACNSALTYLMERDLPVTHGVAIDQGEAMLAPHEFGKAWDVDYLLGSAVSPKLVELLLDKKRRLKFFHSYLGAPSSKDWVPPTSWGIQYVSESQKTEELFLYKTIWPDCVQVGYGLNVVPRAVCLALWLGFKTIRVIGADCAGKPGAPRMPSPPVPPSGMSEAEGQRWVDGVQSPWKASVYVPWLDTIQLYADGRTARSYGDGAVLAEWIENDGTTWHTRADMVISAQHLVHLANTYPQVTLVGKTMPNAMRKMPKEWWDLLPQPTGQGSIRGFRLQSEVEAAAQRQMAAMTAP